VKEKLKLVETIPGMGGGGQRRMMEEVSELLQGSPCTPSTTIKIKYNNNKPNKELSMAKTKQKSCNLFPSPSTQPHWSFSTGSKATSSVLGVVSPADNDLFPSA
jgi:hypothetical protein